MALFSKIASPNPQGSLFQNGANGAHLLSDRTSIQGYSTELSKTLLRLARAKEVAYLITDRSTARCTSPTEMPSMHRRKTMLACC